MRVMVMVMEIESGFAVPGHHQKGRWGRPLNRAMEAEAGAGVLKESAVIDAFESGISFSDDGNPLD